MNQKKKVGRRKIGKIRDFRMSNRDFESFRNWCQRRGFTVSEALRGLIKFVELKGDEKNERLSS